MHCFRRVDAGVAEQLRQGWNRHGRGWGQSCCIQKCGHGSLESIAAVAAGRHALVWIDECGHGMPKVMMMLYGRGESVGYRKRRKNYEHSGREAGDC